MLAAQSISCQVTSAPSPKHGYVGKDDLELVSLGGGSPGRSQGSPAKQVGCPASACCAHHGVALAGEAAEVCLHMCSAWSLLTWRLQLQSPRLSLQPIHLHRLSLQVRLHMASAAQQTGDQGSLTDGLGRTPALWQLQAQSWRHRRHACSLARVPDGLALLLRGRISTSSEVFLHAGKPGPVPAASAMGSREGSFRAGLRSRRSSDPQAQAQTQAQAPSPPQQTPPEGPAKPAAPPLRRVQGTSERLMLQLQGAQLEPDAAAELGRGRCAPACEGLTLHRLHSIAC